MIHIAFLWMRFKNEEEVKKAALKYKECPKIHFWGNKRDEAYIILKVPEDNKFWSDYIGDNPEMSFGGVEANLVYLDNLYIPKEIEISYEKIEGHLSPCGSICIDCPSSKKCSGCPSLNLA
ncbi:hypothetical protein GF319_09540 [Candidatus Bathyarchaeota archaeon]|nr:hypothetical protein [Candidatus Bathyarchaeota archaeon]